MQKFDVYSALLAETDLTLKENQRTTFVVFHRSDIEHLVLHKNSGHFVRE